MDVSIAYPGKTPQNLFGVDSHDKETSSGRGADDCSLHFVNLEAMYAHQDTWEIYVYMGLPLLLVVIVLFASPGVFTQNATATCGPSAKSIGDEEHIYSQISFHDVTPSSNPVASGLLVTSETKGGECWFLERRTNP